MMFADRLTDIRHARGFTLMELMITVVIIGILSAIAYPNYRDHIVETRRADAEIALIQAAAQQEKFFTECSKYADTTGTALACGTTSGTLNYPGVSPEGYYDIAVVAATTGCPIASCFIMEATPKPGTTQATNGKLRIDSAGVRSWDRNNNGIFESTENTWKKN